jgi:hypothetical protein
MEREGAAVMAEAETLENAARGTLIVGHPRTTRRPQKTHRNHSLKRVNIAFRRLCQAGNFAGSHGTRVTA